MNERRLAMMRIIDSRKKFTARELAERFNVSVRTIQRDLDYLQQIGFPLYSEQGAHGGYRALENRILPPLQLTRTEALGLFLMLEMLEKVPDFPFDAIRSHLAVQYYGSLPSDVQTNIDQMRSHISFRLMQLHEPAPWTTEILEASIAKQEIRIGYKSAKGDKDHNVYPFGIYFENGYWYMPARNPEKTLLFRVDRIQHVEKTGAIDPEVPSLAEWMQSTDDRDKAEVVLRFTPFGMRLAKDDPILHSAADGQWSGPVPLEEFPFTARRLLRFGPDVQVVSPPRLRDLVLQLLQDSINQYKE
uniref:helix-turn-helix transcriptional regulator n=2 Tax=Bacillales TaxID=1385 RepID=UPI0011A91731|nr:YafY family protein [Paenibacillus terrae]